MEIIGEPMNLHGTKLGRIILSQEEIAWLFSQLGVEMPASISMPLPKEGKGALPLLLDAAQRALLARGLVQYDAKDRLQIDRGLLAITSIITNPSQVVALARQEKFNPPEQYYFYRVPEMVVMYSLLRPGLYAFDVTTEVDMGKSLVHEWVSYHSGRIRESVSYIINKEDLMKVQQMASGMRIEAVSYLVSVGVSVEDARSFMADIAEPLFSLIVQIIHKPGFRSEQKLFILTTGSDGNWLVESDGPEGEVIQLRCLADEQLNCAVEEFYGLLPSKVRGVDAKE